MSRKHNGFGLVGVVIVVAAFGLLGFIGWRVWASQQSDTADQAKPQQNTADQTVYLTIKEWGVKIPLSEQDKGVYYTLLNGMQQSASDPTYLTVYSKDIDNLSGPAGVSCKGEYVAHLMRLPTSDRRWQPANSIDDGNVDPRYNIRVDIGMYRYAIATQKEYGPSCFETTSGGDYDLDPTTIRDFDAVVNAFKLDFQKIKIE